jgi:cyclic beta-1,2-glucan synthetase
VILTPAARPSDRTDLEQALRSLSDLAGNLAAGKARPLDLQSRRDQLSTIYKAFDRGQGAGRTTSRSEEWFLDNRHVIEDALASLKRDMPGGYVRSLPQLNGEDGVVEPVVTALARVLLDHGGLPIETSWIEHTVEHYQDLHALTIGELWALPAFLALNVIDRLIAIGQELTAHRDSTEQGDQVEIADAVAGGVLSLRALAAHDWRQSFERLSHVDRILRRDPGEAYAAMDFLTRDRYRQQVEYLAKRSPVSETEVAELIVHLSLGASPAKPRHRHVGYWLVAGGRQRLREAIGFRPDMRQRALDLAESHPGTVYFSLASLFAAVPLVLLASYLWVSAAAWPLIVFMLVVTAIPIAGLAVAMVNGLVTWLVPPRALARMDFEHNGIPEEFRTAVVVPVIFAGPKDVDPVFRKLEVNFLANDDPSLTFMILGDLHDADERECASDEQILKRCRTCIKRLSRQYGNHRFLFLSRERQWNEAEGCWMGWERKRGKLMEFNRLLAGTEDTSFNVVEGQGERLQGNRYVLTLDADTRLPPGSARQLVGTLAHPLSRAVLDHDNGALKAGYSIIQPRLEVDPDTTSATSFTRIFSGDTTVDLYTHASSDVYHDLFGEGIFTGKGIYDWRALEHSLSDRIPENTLLSHDLLEGIHGRVGLASDVVLMEQFPSSVVAFMRRQHRWIRGDWQLLPWLRRKVRTTSGLRRRNTLKLIHRWKIVDNLRRSIQPPAVLALLLIAFSGVLPGLDWLWALLFALLLGPGLVTEILDVFGRTVVAPRSAWPRLRRLPGDLAREFQYWVLNLVLLPYQSAILVDAIARALVRMTITRKHLLEWTTAAHTQRGLGSARRHLWREMWTAPTLAVVIIALLAYFNPAMLPLATPLLLGWLLAPWIAGQIDRSSIRPEPDLDASSRALLRQIGRRTWLFFERFVGPDTHWLPPDNFQEDPRVILAERTSPTNIGMALNSALAAHDMGWFDCLSLAAWLGNSMDGMRQLERYRGHWLNWYELRDLNRLEPAYVSTVDSGNLAVSLITLSRGLDELIRTPLDPVGLVHGLSDTLSVIAETVQALPGVVPAHERSRQLLMTINHQRQELADTDRKNCWQLLESWRQRYLDELADDVIGLAEDEGVVVSAEAIAELRVWIDELDAQISRCRHAISGLLPWLPDIEAFESIATASSASESDWQRLTALLTGDWKLSSWPNRHRRLNALINGLRESGGAEGKPANPEMLELLEKLTRQLEYSHGVARQLRTDLFGIIEQADCWAGEMDFRFLYDEDRHLFRIGFDVSNAAPDPNYYDLLASEARLASLFAIATSQVPPRHWLHLGRPIRRRHGRGILMSWGATLFEYMMPRLYAHTPANSLLGSASRSAIALHREFADRYQVPWGISESAYYQLDEQQVYAYRAFGVPGLGFRRDLGERLVISPYSCILALPFAPRAVADNLRRIKSLRGIGLYGCYEALDFGRRISKKARRARIVKAWMSHHQGMALLAIDNYLSDDVMVRRFHANPHIAGVSMLLHERLPRVLPELPVRTQTEKTRTPQVATDPFAWPAESRPPSARYSVLSNGQYSINVNSSGGGGSAWQGIMINRWQPDATTNTWGHWVYVRDLDTGELFSISADPAGSASPDRQVLMAAHFVEFRCRQHDLLCRMRLAVAAQHDIEVRKLLISNESSRPRRLMIVSFAELAMAPSRDLERHPTFARLFVESECLADEKTLLYRRRPRSSQDRPMYVGHSLVPPMGQKVQFGWDSDRQSFLGRGHSEQSPVGLAAGVDNMAQRTGAVVDPAMALGVEVTLDPYSRLEMGLLTGAGRSRRELLGALRGYQALGRIDWVFEQARMQTSLELHHLQLPPENVRTAMELLSALQAPDCTWRRASEKPNEPLQAMLWSRGISGDWPIIVVETGGNAGVDKVVEVLTAHTFLSGRRIRSDLVLLDPAAGGYEQVTRDRLQALSESIRSRTQRVLAGQVTVIPARELSPEQYQGLLAAASVVLRADGAPLSEQLQAQRNQELPPLVPTRSTLAAESFTPELEPIKDLVYDNGYGGFSADGREYIIHRTEFEQTPAPWCNVLANPIFGSLVTESGSSFTWSDNSSEYRLTPWPNDPVQDLPGDALYIRDEETGRFWSSTPSPRSGQGPYRVHHGIGYSRFIHHGNGLSHDLRIHVDVESPVQICRLELTNHCDWTRRLTVTRYVEWVLGNRRGETALHIDCDISMARQVLLARNRYDRFAGDRHGFLVASLPMHGFTTDRTEFLGQGGSVRDPAALHRIGLSGHIEAGTDPCGAIQTHVDIQPGQTVTVIYVLGHSDSREQALELATRFADADAADKSFDRLEADWQDMLGRVQVSTPEPSFNLLLNHWLPYQAISARLLGRTGYYQSSGGFGFRDQLQDAMAMVWLRPSVTHEQILRAASRQFVEGDVLHWWHEMPLRGVRTRCSDDLLWLPLVTAHYVRSTGDTEILDEIVPYLDGQPLSAQEAERYAEYGQSERQGTLYEHCCRAIDRASTVGPHGLPIIGSGDWNDGFNRISTTGRGESVWMGWFLMRVLNDFGECCQIQNDPDSRDQYQKLAAQLAERIDEHAWDGQWYRRAYYDDGTPVGSAESDECQIDLIAQTWSVLGPAEPGERAATAMRSALDRLVSYPDRLILLLTPPFDQTRHDPGYIKGYPPGIRENGAQYTHAATWAVWAAARLGWNHEAAELFRLLDPIRRSTTADEARLYRLEPYVLAGDIYSIGENRGRGGWSWYTGAAAWLYRTGVEALFGLQLDGDELIIKPCLPPEWKKCEIKLKVRGTEYHIDYVQELGDAESVGTTISVAGQTVPSDRVSLIQDSKPVKIQVAVTLAT